MLNYGHTIGHAVESASGFDLLHGEAVAIGMIGAGLIEIKTGIGDERRLERVRRVLARLEVPLTIPAGLNKSDLIELIRRDKKAINRWPKFVLIDKIGHVYCRDGQYAVDVAQDVVEEVVEHLF
jgi:3-dehydroquinate synthase